MTRSGQTGAAVSELAPETATKRDLSEWLTNHGLDVAWEQENQFGYDVFQVNEAPEKPDLIAQSDLLNVAIETKRGDQKSATYQALLQNHDYWLNHRTGRTVYELNGAPVDIDGFVVANDHSIRGWLFGSDYERLITYDQFGEGRQYAVDTGQLPRSEGSMSEEFTRIQWRVAKKASTSFNTGVGALLSTALDGEINDPKPAVLWTVGTEQRWVPL